MARFSLKRNLEKIVGSAKNLILASLASLAIATSVYSQDIVSGNIQSVPSQLGLDSAEVIFTNTSTQKKYAALTDSLGDFTLNVPNGSYNRKVLAKNHFLYADSMLTPTAINGNVSDMNMQIIENLDITEKNYYNNILEEFENIGAGYGYGNYASGGQNIRWKNSLRPIPLYLDSVDAPNGWAAQADSAVAELSGSKTLNKVEWNIKPSDVNVGVSIKYVHNDQMPPNGVGAPGYTKMTYDNNIDFSHATCYINTDANDTSTVRIVVRRELERALGLQSFSPDPNSDMDEIGNYANILSHDDGLVLAVQYSLNNLLRLDPYFDSVVSAIDTSAPSNASFRVSPDSISEYNGSVSVTGYSGC